ncbi:MAG: hypothetical protein IPM82_23770 [Saprospiraceae bacterium]|nr:hypothetical protein [Saprospiraceae bacterium]
MLVPNISTTQARVMVKAVGNIFFDISNQNFKIEIATVPSFTLQTTPSTASACQSGTASYAFNMLQLAGFNTPVTFTASGVPAGATAVFTPNNVPPPANVGLTISNLGGVPSGTYPITVTATGGSVTQTTNIVLVVLDQVTSSVSSAARRRGGGHSLPTDADLGRRAQCLRVPRGGVGIARFQFDFCHWHSHHQLVASEHTLRLPRRLLLAGAGAKSL